LQWFAKCLYHSINCLAANFYSLSDLIFLVTIQVFLATSVTSANLWTLFAVVQTHCLVTSLLLGWNVYYLLPHSHAEWNLRLVCKISCRVDLSSDVFRTKYCLSLPKMTLTDLGTLKMSALGSQVTSAFLAHPVCVCNSLHSKIVFDDMFVHCDSVMDMSLMD